MIINGKRALAYVVTIDEIKPIEGYDRVEYARTNGWWCIISKNDNIQVGDKCVYFEVDSKVNAEDARFAFLDKRHYKIKTQKMCKVVSQGLLMPLKLFPELGDAEVNTDVTDILKVTYSKDENQKTYHDHNIYWDLAFKYDIENKLRGYLETHPRCTYVCIQGEGVGNVQGNPLKLEEDDLYVFNFINSERGRFDSIVGKAVIEEMGMKWVPILDENYHMPDNMEDFKKYADGPSAVNPKVKREGVVIRNPKDDFSFKNVSREYLLKHGG